MARRKALPKLDEKFFRAYCIDFDEEFDFDKLRRDDAGFFDALDKSGLTLVLSHYNIQMSLKYLYNLYVTEQAVINGTATVDGDYATLSGLCINTQFKEFSEVFDGQDFSKLGVFNANRMAFFKVAQSLGCFDEVDQTSKARRKFASKFLLESLKEYASEYNYPLEDDIHPLSREFTVGKLGFLLFDQKTINLSALEMLAQKKDGKFANLNAVAEACAISGSVSKIVYKDGLTQSKIYNQMKGDISRLFDDLQNAFSDIRRDVSYFYSLVFSYPTGKQVADMWNFAQMLRKNNLKFPVNYARKLLLEGGLELFENANFKVFKNEMQRQRYEIIVTTDADGQTRRYKRTKDSLLEKLFALPESTQAKALNFAQAIGCFSEQKILDKNGKPTGELLCNKASVLFSQLFDQDLLPFGEFGFCSELSYNIKPNQNLTNFLAVQGKDKKFQNIDLLHDLNNKYSNIFNCVMQNFDVISNLRHQLTPLGTPKTLTWESVIESYYRKSLGLIDLASVQPQNMDIATLFNDHNILNKHYEKAVQLRNEAIKNQVPKHILGHPLQEKTPDELEKECQNLSDGELSAKIEEINLAKKKNYYFEFLDKRDAKNFVIGLFANCCATITGNTYGAKIAEASVTSPDIQNLVVKNPSGQIVAKGAFYLNRKTGEMIFNDFEIDATYKNYSADQYGVYKLNNPSAIKLAREREYIFNAFQRGIYAFAKEYDKQNPQRPLMRVNVGGGYNRLAMSCNRFNQSLPSQIISIPKNYSFIDAMSMQYILYDRDKVRSGEMQIESLDDIDKFVLQLIKDDKQKNHDVDYVL